VKEEGILLIAEEAEKEEEDDVRKKTRAAEEVDTLLDAGPYVLRTRKGK